MILDYASSFAGFDETQGQRFRAGNLAGLRAVGNEDARLAVAFTVVILNGPRIRDHHGGTEPGEPFREQIPAARQAIPFFAPALDAIDIQRHRDARLQEPTDRRQAPADVPRVPPSHEVEIGQGKADHADSRVRQLGDQRRLLGAGTFAGL